MKQIKVLLSLVIVAAVLFASALPAAAIDFVAEEKYESVFIIRSGSALGSGFALGSNCIVTNAHVIKNPLQVTVWSYDGTERSAQVVGMDEDQDIAVLAVADGQFPVLNVADVEQMRIGDDVYAIGAPKSMAYTLTKGVISAKEREVGRYTYIQTDAPINEGNSGGPLLNAAGQVLGMNTLKMNDSEGIGMAIPIDRICKYLEDLGIGLDETGNVDGTLGTQPSQQTPTRAPEEETVQIPETTPPEQTPRPAPERTEPEEEGPSFLTTVLSVVCVASIVLNIVLAVMLIHQKQKNLNLKYDPSERTDFDIDILG